MAAGDSVNLAEFRCCSDSGEQSVVLPFAVTAAVLGVASAIAGFDSGTIWATDSGVLLSTRESVLVEEALVALAGCWAVSSGRGSAVVVSGGFAIDDDEESDIEHYQERRFSRWIVDLGGR